MKTYTKRPGKTAHTPSTTPLQKKQLPTSSFQHMANNSPQVKQAKSWQQMANNSTQVQEAAQLKSMANSTLPQSKPPVEQTSNHTGLPDNLKTGIENLSGYSMDDVTVHRNSSKPAQLQAHAYAQGTDIHLGPGQEKHLPHEAWHVVQQKQGRVKPTLQMKGNVQINDDDGLEKEADVMGGKALKNTLRSDKPDTMTENPGLSNTTQLAVMQFADSYLYGSANSKTHIHSYSGGDCHIQIYHRGRTKRYNIIKNGELHPKAYTALEAAEEQNNARLCSIIENIIKSHNEDSEDHEDSEDSQPADFESMDEMWRNLKIDKNNKWGPKYR